MPRQQRIRIVIEIGIGCLGLLAMIVAAPLFAAFSGWLNWADIDPNKIDSLNAYFASMQQTSEICRVIQILGLGAAALGAVCVVVELAKWFIGPKQQTDLLPATQSTPMAARSTNSTPFPSGGGIPTRRRATS